MATAVGRMPVALLHRRKPQPQQAATQPFKLRPWKASLSKKYHTSLETQCSSLKYCITTQSYKSNLLLSTCNCHHTCSDSSGGISSSSISALFRSNAAAVIDGNVVVNRHFIPFRSPRGDTMAPQERQHFAPRSHYSNIISSTQYEEPAPGDPRCQLLSPYGILQSTHMTCGIGSSGICHQILGGQGHGCTCHFTRNNISLT